eukprot:g59010.t1
MQQVLVVPFAASIMWLLICIYLLARALMQQRTYYRTTAKHGTVLSRRDNPLIKLLITRTVTFLMAIVFLIHPAVQSLAASPSSCMVLARSSGLFWVLFNMCLYAFLSARLSTASVLHLNARKKWVRNLHTIINYVILGVFVFAIAVAVFIRGQFDTDGYGCTFVVPHALSITMIVIDSVLTFSLLYLFLDLIRTLPASETQIYKNITRRNMRAAIVGQSSTVLFMVTLICGDEILNHHAAHMIRLLTPMLGGACITVNCCCVWYCFGSFTVEMEGRGSKQKDHGNSVCNSTPEVCFDDARAISLNIAPNGNTSSTDNLNTSKSSRLKGSAVRSYRSVAPAPTPPMAPPSMSPPEGPAGEAGEATNLWWLVKLRVWGLTSVSEGQEKSVAKSRNSSQVTAMFVEGTGTPADGSRCKSKVGSKLGSVAEGNEHVSMHASEIMEAVEAAVGKSEFQPPSLAPHPSPTLGADTSPVVSQHGLHSGSPKAPQHTVQPSPAPLPQHSFNPSPPLGQHALHPQPTQPKDTLPLDSGRMIIPPGKKLKELEDILVTKAKQEGLANTCRWQKVRRLDILAGRDLQDLLVGEKEEHLRNVGKSRKVNKKEKTGRKKAGEGAIVEPSDPSRDTSRQTVSALGAEEGKAVPSQSLDRKAEQAENKTIDTKTLDPSSPFHLRRSMPGSPAAKKRRRPAHAPPKPPSGFISPSASPPWLATLQVEAEEGSKKYEEGSSSKCEDVSSNSKCEGSSICEDGAEVCSLSP